MKQVRFGVLACSSVARRRMLPALLAAGNARLERIGSRSPEKAKEFAREFHCEKSGSYEDVLRDKDVDAVYISTPPPMHEHWIRAAAKQGKHVYCEKPSFASSELAIEMFGLFRKKGLRLMEGYAFRYHPQHAAAKELIRQGRIGSPRLFQGWSIYPRPAPKDFRLQPALGGGVFLDAAGYGVAAAMDLFDSSPVSVFCATTVDESSRVDDSVSMILQFPGGRTAQNFSAFGLQYRARYAATGTAGRLELERAYAIGHDVKARITLEADSGQEVVELPPADQFKLMIEDFSSAVLGEKFSGADWEGKALRLQRVMDAARKSFEEKRLVSPTEGAA